MTDPIFVKTRHVYSSYQDFWKLVELAAFPVCFIDEMQPDSDNTYILPVRNGECDAGWPGARARIIHWHAEYHVDYEPLPDVELWSPDAWHAEHIGGRYVPMGSDARLADGPVVKHAPDYDLAFIAYMIPRRTDIVHQLAQRGVRLSPPSAWGNERHKVLTHATAYLHVHQTDYAPAVPALRMVVAAAYSLPVITETPAQRGIFDMGYMLTSDHRYLAEFAWMWSVKEKGGFLADLGRSIHGLLCDQVPFRRSVEVAL